MKIVEQTYSKLTLRDSAGCIWFLGLFFLVIAGTFVAGLSGLFTNLNELSELEKAGAWIVSLSGVAAGIWIIYTHPGISVSFDKSTNTATINRRGLLKKETENYRLREIEDVVIDESVDSDGDPFYRIALKLKYDKQVNLSSVGGHDKATQQKTADLIKSFIKN
jgi:hypothetical protein